MEFKDELELIATPDGLVWLYDEDAREFTLTEFILVEEE